MHRESLPPSLSLSIIFTSGAVRQGKDTIMRGEAENRLTLAFYRITCWENSDFWAALTYLFISIFIYFIYFSICLSICFSLSPLSRALTGRAGVRCWRVKGLVENIMMHTLESSGVSQRGRQMEGWKDRVLVRLPDPLQNFHSEDSFRIRQRAICPRETSLYVHVSLLYNIIIFYKLSEHIISVFNNMQTHEFVPSHIYCMVYGMY